MVDFVAIKDACDFLLKASSVQTHPMFSAKIINWVKAIQELEQEYLSDKGAKDRGNV